MDRRKKREFIALACFGLSIALPLQAVRTTKVEIDPSVLFQPIEGFGASDAWNVEHVGMHYSEQSKEAIARLLFSRGFDESGNPEGIGLSIWRFNIGAGSAEQGEAGGITNPIHRVECFLNHDGSYDFNKQAGQRWFLRKSRDWGVESLIAFCNSPPVHFTRNGIAHGSGGFTSNLKPDAYGDYAGFLVRTLQHFRDIGIPFEYISPVNEPQYEWETTKQEGSPYTNKEIFDLYTILNQQLVEADMTTMIYGPECADYRNVLGTKGEKDHSQQLQYFWHPNSPFFLGKLPKVAPVFAVHSYWTTYTNEMIRELREPVSDACASYEVGLHMSEYSLIGLDHVKDDRPDPASEIDIALFIAKIIQSDMIFANARSWSFWTALAEAGKSLNRYSLIEISNDPSKNAYYRPNKTLWTLGHFSRFLRPGAFRTSCRYRDGSGKLLISSYLHNDGVTVVTVVLNLDDEERHIEISFKRSEATGAGHAYLTDKDLDLSPIKPSGTSNGWIVPARSIQTILTPVKHYK